MAIGKGRPVSKEQFMDEGQVLFFEGLSFGWVVDKRTLNEMRIDKFTREMVLSSIFERLAALDDKTTEE